MSVQAQTRYTLEEYFELEQQASIKHEFINGKIRPMTYTSRPHGKIVHNIDRLLGNHFFDSDMNVYPGDRMLYVPDCNKVYYPDLMVIPENAEPFDYKGKMQAELYPTALIEILSDSTEEDDRDEKWHCYRKIAGLQQYVLVAQKRMEVEIYTHQTGNRWQYAAFEQEEDQVDIAGCKMKLKHIYHKVTFPASEKNASS